MGVFALHKINGKRIGIISDTHGSSKGWNAALAVLGNIDALLHSGDILSHRYFGDQSVCALANEINALAVEKPVYIAMGNCDRFSDSEDLIPAIEQCVTAEWNGHVIAMMHGDDSRALLANARAVGADVVISGHTHVAQIVKKGGILFVNPGSASRPRGNEPASCAVADENGVSVLAFDGKVICHAAW